MTTEVAGTVVLKAQRAQPFFARHPWVFAGAIQAVSGNPPDGAVVDVRTDAGKFIARGLFNRQSKIHARLYSWDEGDSLDRAFFKHRLERAVALRHDVLRLNRSPRSAYRAVFSEADQLSGLVVDRYADHLAVQFTSLGLAERRHLIAELLTEVLQPAGIYLRTEKGVGQLEGVTLTDGLLSGTAPPAEVVVEENGLQFAANLAEGQKTGYYLDQRDNRQAVRHLAAGRRVLDAFSYSGGFGVYAAAGGAVAVDCVDASEPALKLAARNAELNGLTQLKFHQADVFKHLDGLVTSGAKYDLIVLDPPKFARNRAALPKAMQGYRKLHKQALKLLDRDGLLVSCCCTGLVSPGDFEEVIAQAVADGRRDVQILERRGPAADHPVGIAAREGGYLKCVVMRVS
jgi:23S rRNA (cytosine1962-C5)-methyltransferase